ncbi:unnamed protein product [Toxocara canis]|uniref:Protein phosphatase inhibitor n=1 Tax=Toxocara canis TaxID=6265 RepID=A0A183V8S9_TOXCA|nr:unnamed protein product [Toxocara canis]
MFKKAASEISTVTDGWDDLDDDTDFSKQAMHKDDRTQEGSADDEDDWSNDWETQSKTPIETKKSITSAAPSKPKSQHHGGVLKLNAPAKKSLPDDDLDYLLGVTSQSKNSADIRNTTANTATDSLFTIKTEGESSGDGWDTGVDSAGWDDFNDLPTAAKSSTQSASAWDDVNWGDETSKASSDGLRNKEARRAELAARNEARRKELAAKRAAKSRLGAHK